MSRLFREKFSRTELVLSLLSRETRRTLLSRDSRSMVMRSFASAGDDLSVVRIVAFDKLGDKL